MLTLSIETLSEGFARDRRVFATGKLELMKTILDSVAMHKGGLVLPPLIQAVVDMSIQQLGDAFAKMLDAVDDRFFELADRLARSSDAKEQKQLKEELARMTFGE